MSDNFLNVIPVNASFVPDITAQYNAKTFLAQRYTDNQMEFITTDKTEFVDQGANFDAVSCNLCGHVLDTEVWQNAMDNAFQNQFKDLQFRTPCCNKVTSLNDLKYEMPAGFARYIMRIANPQTGLSNDEISKLEDVVGTKLKVVWSHY